MMAVTGRMARQVPLVVILGATGTGKSKLAIEIAQKFKGEIISADSMQVYHGLDIVTNKVTPEEMKICPHHMISYVGPLHQKHTVVDFRNRALPIIDDIKARECVPIIVGGTNYYIEALLWNMLVDKKGPSAIQRAADRTVLPPGGNEENQTKSNREDPPGGARKEVEDSESNSGSEESVGNSFVKYEDKRMKFEDLSTEQLYAKLREVDLLSTERIHPNDRRKILRALEVYEEGGRRLSEVLEEQHQEVGGEGVSGAVRYDPTAIIWIKCDQQVLDERVDKRVDQMIEAGLVKELSDFHEQYNKERLKSNESTDYTQGIFQSIGFKEFHEYLLLTEEERKCAKGQALFSLGVEDMKRATRRYAKKQNTWVINRFLKRKGSRVPPVYAVDSTDPSKWDQDAYKPAEQVVEAYLEGRLPKLEPEPCEENKNPSHYNKCEVCDRVFVREKEWQAHLKGRRHRNALKRKKRQEEGQEKVQKLSSECTEKSTDTLA